MVSNLTEVRCPFCKAAIADAEETEGLSVIPYAAAPKTDPHGTFLACPSCQRKIMLEPAKGGFRVSEFQNRTEWG